MNTINHYIGMDPMERGAPYLRMLAPYALIFVAWIFAIFMIYNNRLLNLLMLVPISLPLIFVGFYSYWLYWFDLLRVLQVFSTNVHIWRWNWTGAWANILTMMASIWFARPTVRFMIQKRGHVPAVPAEANRFKR
jgi:hypothetical protein